MTNETEINAWKLRPGVAKVGDEIEYSHGNDLTIRGIVKSIDNSETWGERIHLTDGTNFNLKSIQFDSAFGWVKMRS